MNTIQIAKRFDYADWGGAETVILETGKRLNRLGHPTQVFTTLDAGKRADDANDGLPVRRFPYFYAQFGLDAQQRDALHRKGGSPFSFAMMRALATCPSVDLIHLHTMGRFGGIASHAARRRRIPYVVSLHGGAFDVPKEEAESWARVQAGGFDWGRVLSWWIGARRLLPDSNAVLCVGYPESRLAQQRFPNKRVEYLPNGVDVARFETGDRAAFRAQHGIPQDAYVVLTVARIDRQKNQRMIVEALPLLREVSANAHVVLIGPITNAEYCGSIRAAARDAGVEGALTLIEGLPAGSQELVDAYHAADVFVLPSIHEPFGIVILEAWAAGLPVIASNVGGIPHFVKDGEDGVLFAPGDMAAFVSAFTIVSGGAELAQRCARNGQDKARADYSWDAITERLVKIYAEVVRDAAAHA
ncbi:MAG: glycosyltransferase family 4 protein [Candidatus Hydrogenedentes bacterium]|nr:glycosyltransferase family 4 protein [Candidatus Hydrogenedentota bacterium]